MRPENSPLGLVTWVTLAVTLSEGQSSWGPVGTGSSVCGCGGGDGDHSLSKFGWKVRRPGLEVSLEEVQMRGSGGRCSRRCPWLGVCFRSGGGGRREEPRAQA